MNGNCKIENSTDTKKNANSNSIEEIIEDLKNGRIVLVTDDENRENEGDLICAAQFATTENVNFMAKYGRGLICMPVSQKIAERLELFPMTSKNTDNHETAFTVSIDHISTTTGISAVERSVTAISCADKNSSPRDFRRPGHLFPLIAVEGGVLVRNGHTEATVDLCKIAGLEECGLCCEIMAEDGTMLRAEGIKKFALEHNLKMTSIKELQAWRKSHEILLEKTDEVFLPTEYGEFKMAAFTDKLTGKEHSALIKGDIAGAENVLCRIHSECLTGDVFGSMRCDCGKQLKKAMQEIQDAGQGIIIYLRQEGRGIGLFNKLKAYKLQENGMDTVEANEALGFAGDEREYYAAAQILNFYGIKNIRLLTNNPDKIEQLKAYNIKITERCPLQIQANEYDKKYLMTKQNKMGHLFRYD